MVKDILEQIEAEIDENSEEYRIYRDMMIVAGNIRRVMLEKKITSSELSKKMNTTKSAVSRWLSGNENIGSHNISRIALILGVETYTLWVPHKKDRPRKDTLTETGRIEKTNPAYLQTAKMQQVDIAHTFYEAISAKAITITKAYEGISSALAITITNLHSKELQVLKRFSDVQHELSSKRTIEEENEETA